MARTESCRLTVRSAEDDRTRADDLCPLDEDQLVVANPFLHHLVRRPEVPRLERLLPFEVGQTRHERRARRFRDPAQVLLLAPPDGHRARLDKLFQAQVVDTFRRQDDVGSRREDLADPLDRNVGLAVSANTGREQRLVARPKPPGPTG
jgi:hypothetical protein